VLTAVQVPKVIREWKREIAEEKRKFPGPQNLR
jgi:hypothetical protein